MKGLDGSFAGRTFDGVFADTFKISLRVDQTATGTLLGNEGVANEISLNETIGPGGFRLSLPPTSQGFSIFN